jgi:hypothetical protein
MSRGPGQFHVKPHSLGRLRTPGALGKVIGFTWNCRLDLARQGGSGADTLPT